MFTRWDLFCRVVDNFGDIGVCWRLACALAAQGDVVRLFSDDLSALAWMAPAGHERVQALHWPAEDDRRVVPADVVVEAFGCTLPAAFVDGMVQRTPAPVWINLEYLSAEAYVERSHGLPSPQASGLVKWFFYPGFTPHTGGLLHEPGLQAARDAFDRHAWLGRLGLAAAPGERLVSLFCYDNPALPALLPRLAEQPTLLLLTPGHAQRLTAAAGPLPAGLRTATLPWLTQPDYDHLLWACDLNFVRGEDSLVRAIWAGKPFVWQAYPQHDGAHAAKLEALLQRLQPGEEAAAWWRAWNGLRPLPPAWPATGPWSTACLAWRDRLWTQADLATQLRRFAHGKLQGSR